jgi:DHA1 family multidrug resistance protein-like MFS transporter
MKIKLQTALPVLIAMGVAFFFRTTNSALNVFFPLYGSRVLHLNSGKIGVIFGIQGFLSFAIMFLTSFIKSLKKTSKALILLLASGLIVLLSASLLGGLIERSFAFYFAVALTGIGTALVVPAIVTLVGLMGSGKKERRVITYSISLSLALLLGPSIEALILRLTHDNLRIAIIACFVPASIALGLNALYLIEARKYPAIQSNEEEVHFVKELRVQNKLKKTAIYLQLMYEVPFEATIVFGGLLGSHLDHLSLQTIALSYSVFFFISLLVRSTLSVVQTLRIFDYLIYSAFGVSLGGVILISIRGAVFYFAAYILLGVAHGITYPLGLSMTSVASPADELIKSNAIMSYWTQLVNFAAPIILGGLVNLYGYIIGFRAILIPVAIIGLLLLIETRSLRRLILTNKLKL